MSISKIILEIFFPKICLNCQREGDWLCQDCLATLEILDLHQKYPSKNLNDLYFGLPYQKSLIKKLIQKFKYSPFIKELSQVLASIVINHFQLLDNVENFSEYILIPVPLEKKKLRWRGFNQAEEIAKELTKFFKRPLLSDCLIKVKETQAQIDLSKKERRENIRGVFLVKNAERIKGRKILLIDDVYTTGSTMEECARVLKEAGAKEIVGIVVARASPGQDKFQNL